MKFPPPARTANRCGQPTPVPGFCAAALLLGALLAWGRGSAADEIAPEDPQLVRDVDFHADVYPVLRRNCLACHNDTVQENDLVLETAALMQQGGASGAGLVPGKPDESLIYLVAAQREEPVMPPADNKVAARPLTPRELGVLRQWILEGARAGERPVEPGPEWRAIPESFSAVFSLALLPDQRHFAAARGNRILIYDRLTGNEVSRLIDPSLDDGAAQRDFVQALAVSPDGRWIASGDFRVVRLWERQPPQRRAAVALSQAVRKMAIAPSGDCAAFVLDDNSLAVWTPADGSLRPLPPSPAPLTAIAFPGDEERLLLGDDKGRLSLIHVSDGRTLASRETASPITALAVSQTPAGWFTAHADGRIRQWDAVDGEGGVVREFAGHEQPATEIVWIESTRELVSASADGTIRVWPTVGNAEPQIAAFNVPATALAVSRDGQRVVFSGPRGGPRIWHRERGVVAQPAPEGTPAKIGAGGVGVSPFTAPQGRASAVAAERLLKDDREAAGQTLDRAQKLLQEAIDEQAQRKKALAEAEKQDAAAQKTARKAEESLASGEKTFAEALSSREAAPDDEAAQSAVGEAEQALAALRTAQQEASDKAVASERNLRLARAALDDADAEAARRRGQQEQSETAQTAAQGRLDEFLQSRPDVEFATRSLTLFDDDAVAITAQEGFPLQIWDARSGEGLAEIALPTHAAPQATAHGSDAADASDESDATFVAAAGSAVLTIDTQGRVSLWDVAPRWKLAAVLGPLSASSANLQDSVFPDRVTALAFRRDGKLLAAGGGEPSRSGELAIWNMADRTLQTLIPEAHSDSVQALEFSRDGRQLLSGAADRMVKLFEIDSGRLVRTFEGHTDHVLGVGFQAAGGSLASASADKTIKVWNAETGGQLRTISSYSKQATALTYLGVSDDLLSCSGDGNVRIHRASNGQNSQTLSVAGDYLHAVAASADGRWILAAGELGGIHLWERRDDKYVETLVVPPAR